MNRSLSYDHMPQEVSAKLAAEQASPSTTTATPPKSILKTRTLDESLSSSSSSSYPSSRRFKNVDFDIIQIHEHPIIRAHCDTDNGGPALTIDWQPVAEHVTTVQEREIERPVSNTSRTKVYCKAERVLILMKMGYSMQELAEQYDLEADTTPTPSPLSTRSGGLKKSVSRDQLKGRLKKSSSKDRDLNNNNGMKLKKTSSVDEMYKKLKGAAKRMTRTSSSNRIAASPSSSNSSVGSSSSSSSKRRSSSAKTALQVRNSLLEAVAQQQKESPIGNSSSPLTPSFVTC